MKGRKTVEVEQMIKWGNIQLGRTDEYADVGFKLGISTMVERVLFNSKNYNGFQFINNYDSEVGTVGYYSRYYHLPKS
mgnify:CR=1|jgi:hypothetical protein|tara:strand:+ start:85 stop:318 length:234 start_codon:yes stop_codon:yes gene_type:complete